MVYEASLQDIKDRVNENNYSNARNKLDTLIVQVQAYILTLTSQEDIDAWNFTLNNLEHTKEHMVTFDIHTYQKDACLKQLNGIVTI